MVTLCLHFSAASENAYIVYILEDTESIGMLRRDKVSMLHIPFL